VLGLRDAGLFAPGAGCGYPASGVRLARRTRTTHAPRLTAVFSRLVVCVPLLAACITAPWASASAPGAAASTPVRCAAADLRYGIQDGMPRHFGVWRLEVSGASCTTAHTIAKAWQRRFERSATATLPRRIGAFRFRSLPPNAAQTYRLRGTRGATIVRFDYVVANG
jgi:hypothetical protein